MKNHWKDNGKDFFLPIKVISKTFRGKYMAELKQLWENDRLEFHGSAAPYKNYYTFKELLNTCYTKEWIPYCKKPFDGAESVIRYLGKYTHRIAISNYRIKDMTESTVTFSAKDYKNQGLWKEITISGEEFIRRFLMHVPPKRFVRIRHYGLLSSRNKKKKITLCRNILGCKKYISKLKDMDAPAIIRLLYNKDICKCSSCADRDKIKTTLEKIDADAFDLAVDTILQSRKIYIVGIRSCAPLASFLAFYMNLMFEDVCLLTTNSSSELFEQMVRIGKDDVIIGISFPRYSMRTLKALEFANNRSAKVITITDSIHSPMNLYSSCNLIADSDMASIVDSLVAPLSVINALIVALCMKKQSIVAKTLTELEDIWNEYQVYENDEIDYIDDSIKVHYAKLGESQDE